MYVFLIILYKLMLSIHNKQREMQHNQLTKVNV